jgi:hypothetical protein
VSREELDELLQREFGRAGGARAAGNEGMVRVCARRAAGAALEFWLERHPGSSRATDAVGRLRLVERAQGVPEDVRIAAARLTARVAGDFSSPFPTDPLEDARQIVRFFTGTDEDRAF